jgi:prophage tail gpP-like protein
MGRVELVVGGFAYEGWKAIRVNRTLERASGSFVLDVSDRWAAAADTWPIREEDECRVELDGQVAINGFVDARDQGFGPDSTRLSFTGRDGTAALSECSALLDKFQFRNVALLELAKKLAAPYGIRVVAAAGTTLPPPIAKFSINPGETAYAVLQRAASASGILIVTNSAGELVLTQSGLGRADALIQGQNVISGDIAYNFKERFSRYVVGTQISGTDAASGNSTRIRGEARDLEVRRTERILVVRPEHGITAESARKRADWEARIRAAKSESLSVTVQGWAQSSGVLWSPNALSSVQIPRLGIGGDMLISDVEFSIGNDAEMTRLKLVRPDAFTPSPKAEVRRGTGSKAFKKIRRDSQGDPIVGGG